MKVGAPPLEEAAGTCQVQRDVIIPRFPAGRETIDMEGREREKNGRWPRRGVVRLGAFDLDGRSVTQRAAAVDAVS